MKVKLLITSITIAVSSAALAQTPAVLTPGSSVLNPVLSSFPSGVNLPYVDATFNEAFTGLNALGQVAFTGYLNSYVFQQANGDLAFAWIIENDATSMDAINHFSVTGYTASRLRSPKTPALASSRTRTLS